jgi:NitT/TauT family transport system ATP-binding protein
MVLDALNRSIMPGELVTLVGPSGCGKSTLFNLILGSIKPTEGEVLVNGEPVTGTGPDRGIVYQKYALFPHLSVLENVMLGGTLTRSVVGNRLTSSRAARRADREQAIAYLERVRMADAINKYPHELSGGMQQRVAIAQALFTHPRIILMDEPFGALDAGTRYDAQLFLIELWKELNEGDSDMTVLFVTHALDEAVFLGSRLMGLSQHWEPEGTARRYDAKGNWIPNGSKIVDDYDLSGEIHLRESLSREEYVSKFTHLMDRLEVTVMDPRTRQHMRDFHVGPPPPAEAMRWVQPDVLMTDG